MDVLTRKSLIVHGYMRKNDKVFGKLNIPKDILDVIIEFYSIFAWDKNTSNHGFDIDNLTIYTTSKVSDWISGFSVDSISSGSITWTIKAIDIKGGVLIGIIDHDYLNKGIRHFWKTSGIYIHYMHILYNNHK